MPKRKEPMARTVFSLLFLILAVAAWWAGDDAACCFGIVLLFLCDIESELSELREEIKDLQQK